MPYLGPVAWAASLGEGEHRQAIENFATGAGFPIPLVRLVVLVEDKRFWVHPGTDPLAVLRAAYMNLRKRGRMQGGSTIPEQLLKLRSGLIDRTLSSRARRSLLALRLVTTTHRYHLLNEYLQTVYLGRDSWGMKQAAENYFSKRVADITVAESFFLAERIALPHQARAARIRNLLLRPRVRAVIQAEIHQLPGVYRACFAAEAGNSVARILNQLPEPEHAR